MHTGSMETGRMVLTNIDLVVDVVSIVIGLFAIYFVSRLNRNLGGKIKSALTFFVLGVAANVSALFYTTLIGHTFMLNGTAFDVHNLFMAVGMIFFIISTYRFSLLIPRV